MVVTDNKAIMQSRFGMNAIAGSIHAETWVRDSPSSPWLIESDFFSIEEFPPRPSSAAVAAPAPKLKVHEQMDQVRALLRKKMKGRSEVDADMLLGFMQSFDPSFTQDAFNTFMAKGGFETKGLIEVDKFLSYVFLKP